MRIGLALLAGYFLGRRKKLRMAVALAAAGAAGRARGGKGGGGGGGLLSQGIKSLTSSADVAPIVDRLRGDLLEVGKAAAVAAAGRQIDSLSDKLHERAEALRTPEKKPGDDTEQADASERARNGAGEPQDEPRDEPQDEPRDEPQDEPRDEPRDEPEDAAEYEDEGEEPEPTAQEPEEPERTHRRPRMLRRTRRAVRGSTHG
ncbi:hypothetical protein [Nonomuraea rubra]|uniref:DNA primase n=1 Tax=Nonomuraea rubra TaxID=46180 RepID=A0A7X0U5S4_9ACTN|nr:hypothetical protein [Nonomuraea rubra]MBB6555854.1 hypothetical protein [Nonomuraea rubra]